MARFFTLLALSLLASSTIAANVLPIIERQSEGPIQIGELVGKFENRQFLTQNCPETITHGDPVGSTVPHSVIMQNGRQCLGDGSLTLFLDMNDAVNSVSDQGAKDLFMAASSVSNGALYATETAIRRCSGTRVSAGSAIVIVRPVETVSIPSGFPLIAGSRYMILFDPRLAGLCFYAAELLVEPVPTTVEPTPAPVDAAPAPPVVPVETTPKPDDASPAPTTDSDGSGNGGGAGSGDGDGDADSTDGPTTEPSTSEEPESSGDGDDDDDDDDSPCFPAHATVELEDGSVKTMSDVELGDRVKVADGEFSDVYMFTHKDAETRHDFVKMSTESGSTLMVTKGHYMYINGGLAAAGSAKKGDVVELGNGQRTNVAGIEIVKSMGLYNPQTIQGDIIVNGIRSSTFTRTIEPSTAQAMLTPFRMLYDTLGWSTSMLDNGAEMIAQVLPKGQAAL